jgi:hypothetical protein
MVDIGGLPVKGTYCTEVGCCGSIEEGGSFANEFRSRRRLSIEVGIEVLGEDVEEVDDAVGHGLSDIAVLDEEVLGVLREERSSGHPDGRGTVGPDDGEGFFKTSLTFKYGS